MKYLLILILPVVLFAACERGNACLDIRAVNYDAGADKSCCCVYPNLDLKVSHRFGEADFRLDSAYRYEGQPEFIVRELGFLLSGAEVLRDGEVFTVSDTLQIQTDGETIAITDDFVWVEPGAGVRALEGFREPGRFDGLRLTVGVPDAINAVTPGAVFPKNHILASETDSIWSETRRYWFFQTRIIPDISNPEVEKNVIISGNANRLDLEWGGTFTAPLAEDFEVNLTVDYRILFDGVDFVADTEEAIADKVRGNLAEAMGL